MAFLHEHVFDPILDSPRAPKNLKAGVNLTIARMSKLDAAKMRQFYWSAIIGTERSTKFARMMRAEGFARFEDPGVLDDFRERFNDVWLRQ